MHFPRYNGSMVKSMRDSKYALALRKQPTIGAVHLLAEVACAGLKPETK
jgi:hypothetical protein